LTSSSRFGAGGQEARVAELHVGRARIAASDLLSIHAERVSELMQGNGGIIDSDVSVHLSIVQAGLEAIADTPIRLNITCPRDGTPVIYDFAVGKYCCAQRHCPP
jgi:hypothetical protein